MQGRNEQMGRMILTPEITVTSGPCPTSRLHPPLLSSHIQPFSGPTGGSVPCLALELWEMGVQVRLGQGLEALTSVCF